MQVHLHRIWIIPLHFYGELSKDWKDERRNGSDLKVVWRLGIYFNSKSNFLNRDISSSFQTNLITNLQSPLWIQSLKFHYLWKMTFRMCRNNFLTYWLLLKLYDFLKEVFENKLYSNVRKICWCWNLKYLHTWLTILSEPFFIYSEVECESYRVWT